VKLYFSVESVYRKVPRFNSLTASTAKFTTVFVFHSQIISRSPRSYFRALKFVPGSSGFVVHSQIFSTDLVPYSQLLRPYFRTLNFLRPLGPVSRSQIFSKSFLVIFQGFTICLVSYFQIFSHVLWALFLNLNFFPTSFGACFLFSSILDYISEPEKSSQSLSCLVSYSQIISKF
jgi:hypothetical protein